MFPELEQAAHQAAQTPGLYVEPGKPNGQSSTFCASTRAKLVSEGQGAWGMEQGAGAEG